MKVGQIAMEPTNDRPTTSPLNNNDALVDVIYKRLRADILMLDDMPVTEDELAEILKRNPQVVRTSARIQFGPSWSKSRARANATTGSARPGITYRRFALVRRTARR